MGVYAVRKTRKACNWEAKAPNAANSVELGEPLPMGEGVNTEHGSICSGTFHLDLVSTQPAFHSLKA